MRSFVQYGHIWFKEIFQTEKRKLASANKNLGNATERIYVNRAGLQKLKKGDWSEFNYAALKKRHPDNDDLRS